MAGHPRICPLATEGKRRIETRLGQTFQHRVNPDWELHTAVLVPGPCVSGASDLRGV